MERFEGIFVAMNKNGVLEISDITSISGIAFLLLQPLNSRPMTYIRSCKMCKRSFQAPNYATYSVLKVKLFEQRLFSPFFGLVQPPIEMAKMTVESGMVSMGTILKATGLNAQECVFKSIQDLKEIGDAVEQH